MSRFNEYGIHPSLWRAIRKNHSGMVDIKIKNKRGIIIGLAMINRYLNTIFIQDTFKFNDMSIKHLIRDTKNIHQANLKGSIIPIGIRRF